MLAYPGYTVRRIERELSWREVVELMKQWEKEPPAFLVGRTSQKVLQTGLGVKMRQKLMSSEQLVNRLEALGWL